MIQMISETEFQLTKGGHNMTLLKGKWGWEMLTANASTKAYGTLGFRRFDSLEAVEAHYKSWRGISTLLEAA